MKRVVLALSVILASSLVAFAANCPTTTYDVYIVNGFSCGIDDKTFSDFMYTGTSNPPGFAIQAGAIAVTPITTPGAPGLQWSAGWNASTSTGVLTQDSLFQFNVNVNPGGNPITGLTLAIGGVGFNGTGEVIVDETACLGAILPVCSGGTLVTLRVEDDANGQDLVDSINFAGVTEISIAKDIEIQSGTNGDASLSVMSDIFNEGGQSVPEPGTLTMLGTGVLVLAGFARRKFKV